MSSLQIQNTSHVHYFKYVFEILIFEILYNSDSARLPTDYPHPAGICTEGLRNSSHRATSVSRLLPLESMSQYQVAFQPVDEDTLNEF